MRPRLADGLAVGACALVAFAITLGRWGGAWPFLVGGDAANIATWAAALDHPGCFAGDGSIGDPANFRFYWTVHLPGLRGLAPLVGGYGNAFVSLLFFHVWLQAVGFYVLGRAWYGSRRFAFLLALASLAPVALNLHEVWGLLPDPLPRFTFQAALPFLLAAALAFRGRPRAWPWLLLAAGALLYVHPVSAPPWAFAIWLGLWTARPPGESRGRQALRLVGCGALFLLASAPFLAVYLGAHAHGRVAPERFAEVSAVMRALLPRGYLDAPFALREFAAGFLDARALYWLGAAAGVALVVWRWPALRPRAALLGAWIGGLLAVSFAGPFVEQRLAEPLQRLPAQIDLIRGIRYLVPMALLAAFWPLAALDADLRRRGGHAVARGALLAAGVAALAGWLALHPIEELRRTAECWRRGRLVCLPPGWPPAAEAIEQVARETPPGARILPTRLGYAMQIRYHALRPVVHSHRDFSALLYANHDRLLEWYAEHRAEEAVLARTTREARFAGHLERAARLGADYVLLDPTHLPARLPERGSHPVPWERVWRNERYALVRLVRESAPEPAAPPAADCRPAWR